jgi:hypothetical protein
MVKTITLKVDFDTHKKIKLQATNRDMSITGYLLSLAEKDVQEQDAHNKKRTGFTYQS